MNGEIKKTINEIDFTGMSSKDMIYIIENNKARSSIADNPSKMYLVRQAEADIYSSDFSLVRCLLTNLDYDEEFYDLLYIVLLRFPDIEIKLTNADKISKSHKGKIVSLYLEAGNYYFVLKNISFFKDCLFENYSASTYLGKKIFLHFKRIIEVLCEILIKEEVNLDEIKVGTSSIGDMIIEILSVVCMNALNDKLLEKDENGETILEKLLRVDKRIGNKISLIANEHNGVSLPVAKIFYKYGFTPKFNLESAFDNQHKEDFYQQVENSMFITNSMEYQYPHVFTEEQLNLVEKFWKMFEKDSNHTLIKMILNVFYKYLTYNVDRAMEYLKKFIILKEKLPNFTLEHIPYSKREQVGIYSISKIESIYDYYVMNHEIGHFIHENMADFEYPEHIKIMIEKLKSNPNTIKRLQDYALRQQKIIEKEQSSFSKTGFVEYLEGGKEIYLKKLREDYNKLLLELRQLENPSVNNNSQMTFKEYTIMMLKNDSNEFLRLKMDKNICLIESIEGLMDAIFDGKWRDGKLDGVTAKCYGGHGDDYFRDFSNSFMEVFAYFYSLITIPSDKSEQIEKDLRFLLGDDLYDSLLQYCNELNKKVEKVR